MNPFSQNSFRDYAWKEGKPLGIGKLTPEEALDCQVVYKIPSDPYHKHLSIERYEQGQLTSVVYDSHLFDYRHLKPALQMGWEKEWVTENICLIRNGDDRLILREEYLFEGEHCRSCKSYTPHGLLVATQKLLYTHKNDPFSGAILYDLQERPVMWKHYTCDTDGQFDKLLLEQWDSRQPLPG